MSLNAFGCPRSSRESFKKVLSNESSHSPVEKVFHSSGIWVVASYINHSCVGNCRRTFIGDMQIVRATCDMEADTELEFAYLQPDIKTSHIDAKKKFSNWGFVCKCNLCKSRNETSGSILQQRQTILRHLASVLNISGRIDIAKAQSLLNQIYNSYRDPKAIKLELWDPYFAMGAKLRKQGKPSEAITMFAKGLEALGFVITMYPLAGKTKTPELRIHTWGMANDLVPWVFVNLYHCYKELAPNLCLVAKIYAETSYAMVVGEKETIKDTFPGLC